MIKLNNLLNKLGNPQKKLKYVHIAGTNGKGSTAAMIASILHRSGYKVGLFTSPHISCFNERIRINSVPISDEKLEAATNLVNKYVDDSENLSWFAILTAIAFKIFDEEQCDIVVLEVGIGGRVDSTNIIEESEISIITSIGMDHQKTLGDTITSIAREKAGIIKKDGSVILSPQVQEVENEIENICKQQNAKLQKVDMKDFELIEYNTYGQTFNFNEYKNMKISLLGEHQLQNVAGVLCAVNILKEKGWKIDIESVRIGLAQAEWRGRFEIVSRKPIILVDGAHNVQGVEMLVKNLDIYFNGKKIIFVVGTMQDKDYKVMLDLVRPYAKEIITVSPDVEKAVPASDLANYVNSNLCIKSFACDTVENGIKFALDKVSDEEMICVFGSLYIVGIDTWI